MRLPWPSRRSAGRPTGSAAAPAAAGAAAGDGMQPFTARPVGRTEWRDVGTLRPSFRADPGVHAPHFRDELAGSRRPDPILRPLGHERSADGPAGLVSGITRPVIARVIEGPGGTRSLPLAHKRAGEHRSGPISAEASMPGTEPAIPALPPIQLRQLPVVSGASIRRDHRPSKAAT